MPVCFGESIVLIKSSFIVNPFHLCQFGGKQNPAFGSCGSFGTSRPHFSLKIVQGDRFPTFLLFVQSYTWNRFVIFLFRGTGLWPSSGEENTYIKDSKEFPVSLQLLRSRFLTRCSRYDWKGISSTTRLLLAFEWISYVLARSVKCIVFVVPKKLLGFSELKWFHLISLVAFVLLCFLLQISCAPCNEVLECFTGFGVLHSNSRTKVFCV